MAILGGIGIRPRETMPVVDWEIEEERAKELAVGRCQPRDFPQGFKCSEKFTNWFHGAQAGSLCHLLSLPLLFPTPLFASHDHPMPWYKDGKDWYHCIEFESLLLTVTADDKMAIATLGSTSFIVDEAGVVVDTQYSVEVVHILESESYYQESTQVWHHTFVVDWYDLVATFTALVFGRRIESLILKLESSPHSSRSPRLCLVSV
ncbi:hypothetical protein B296_00003010 [Ensete ventricosum]|uniref:Uncharacterized protein n=1 Tax=Ensete ventricosum TaxID=4639 RepID=A0A427AXW4_ENSVE|nr:hypothetical protein B296_00003010 [Ensete ventricosum]